MLEVAIRSQFGACEYLIADTLDGIRELIPCGRQFLKAHPDQCVCSEHTMARRAELQRQRTAKNRRKKS